MKIFNMNMNPGKLPKDIKLQKKTHVQPPMVNPDFYISSNSLMSAQLNKFDPIQPTKIRDKARMDIIERVDSINAFVRNNTKYRGISFGLDEASGQRYVVVTDDKTGKVLKQIPSEALLNRAGVLRDISGLLTSVMG